MNRTIKGKPANIEFSNNLNLNFILPENWDLEEGKENDFSISEKNGIVDFSIYSPKITEEFTFPNYTSTTEMYPFILSWILPENLNVDRAAVEAFTITKFLKANTYYTSYSLENRTYFAYFIMQSKEKIVIVEGQCAENKKTVALVDLFINSFTN